ncbi:MAG: MFS transporter [Firmicutes bacterium]|nr:MFS transporter [Bacillota bacterium]
MHLVLSYYLFTLLGYVGTVFGPTLPFIIDGFSLSLAQAGTLFFLLSFGHVLGSISMAPLMRRFDSKPIMLLGAVLMAANALAIPFASRWFLMLGNVCVLGVGWGLLEVGFNALVSHWSEGDPGPALNRLHLFFALGAWLGPSLISLLLVGGMAWQLAFFTVAFGFVIFIGIFAKMPAGIFQLAPGKGSHPTGGSLETSEKVTLRHLLAAPGIVLLGLAILIYVGVEFSITGWITTFLTESLGSTAAMGAAAVSFFWAGLTVGRLICSMFFQRVDYLSLLLFLCAGTAISVGLGALIPIPAVAVGCFALAGLFSSGIFPTIVASGARAYPDWISSLSSFFSALAGIGGMLMPWVLGIIADTVGLGGGLIVLSLFMAMAALLAFALKSSGLEQGTGTQMRFFDEMN